MDPGEFFKELLGRSKKAFDPLTSKSSFSKFLIDTIKQQTNSVYSFLQAIKIDLKNVWNTLKGEKNPPPAKSLKLEKWLDILYKLRSIAKLQSEDTKHEYASAFNFYV